MKRFLLAAAFLLLWSLPGFAESAVTITQPWARATILISRPGVAYLTLQSAAADRLIALDTPVAEAVMIHAVENKDGVSHMMGMMALDLPAGQVVTLAPSVTHLMLMGLKAKLVAGDSFALTLHFEHAGAMSVEVPVLGIAAMGPGE